MRMDSTAIMKRFKVLLSPERKRKKSLGFKKTHEKDKYKKINTHTGNSHAIHKQHVHINTNRTFKVPIISSHLVLLWHEGFEHTLPYTLAVNVFIYFMSAV